MKKIFLGFLLLVICIYLFSIRRIEVFDFTDEQITDYHILYDFKGTEFEDSILEDKQVTDKLVDRIREEDYRGVFEFNSGGTVISYVTNGDITLMVRTAKGDDYYSYMFDIDGSGRIRYKKYKSHKLEGYTNLVDKRIRIGFGGNQKIRDLYNDLKVIIEETTEISSKLDYKK